MASQLSTTATSWLLWPTVAHVTKVTLDAVSVPRIVSAFSGSNSEAAMRGRALAALAAALVTLAASETLTSNAHVGGSTEATVDVRPDVEQPPTLHLTGSQTVAVAIRTTPTLDATLIDPASVCFGDPDNALQRDCTETHGRGHIEDVDRDGDMDLLLHYDIHEAGFDRGETTACLEGTSGDKHVYGCDAIRTKDGVPEQNPPDLHLAMTAAPSNLSGGDTAVWTVTVANEGLGAVTVAPTTALLALQLPPGLGQPVLDAPAPYSCTADACRPTEPDTIAVGESRTFTLQAKVPDTSGPVEVRGTADPQGRVSESDEADNAASAQVNVDPPNLTLSLNGQPDPAAPGETTEWKATLRNVGPGGARIPAGAAAIRFATPAGLDGIQLVPPPEFACSSPGDGTHSCSPASLLSIPAGGERTFLLRGVASTQPGGLTVSATADPSGAVGELLEDDNEASDTISVERPNLTVKLDAVPADPLTGDPVQWTATVRNSGPTNVRLPGGAALLRLEHAPDLAGATLSSALGYGCAPSAPQEFLCSASGADVIAPGGERVFVLSARAPDAPAVEMTATADPATLVAESDETDNTARRSLDVRPRGADLSTAMTGSPDPVDARHTVSFTARVTNEGTTDAVLPTGTVAIRFDVAAGMLNLFASTPAGYTCFISGANQVDCQTTTDITIAPGAQVGFTLGGTAPSAPGPITIGAAFDPHESVPEMREDNNSATATVQVRPPDFSISFSGSPDPVDARHSATFVARITNDGPAAARIPSGTRVIRYQIPSNLINLAVSSPPNFTCFIESAGVVDCQSTATMTLAAGAHLEFTLFGTAPKDPGALSVTALADPIDAVPEADETDNSATATVQVQPPDFSITLTAPATADAGSAVQFDATVTNDGPAAARLPISTRLIRFEIPAEVSGHSVSSPAGYQCSSVGDNDIECAPSATTSIPVGGTIQFTLLAPAPATPGSLTVTALADPLSAVPEQDESDNGATAVVTLEQSVH